MSSISNYFNGTEPFSSVSFKQLIDEVKKGSYQSVQPVVEVNHSCEKKPAMPTENTTILDNPGTTVLVNQDILKSQEYQKHYTNPNLSQMMVQEHSPSVYEPKTYPGTIQKSQEQQEIQPKEAPTPEKKKFSLFAKKEKKEPAAKGHEPIGTKPKSFHGIAIPGSDVMPKQENDKPISETAIPAQNVSMPIHNAPIQNFGETVDLKTYAGNIGGVCAVPVSNPKKICLLRKATKEQFFLTKEMTKIACK